jgi:hypothetical protein
MPEDGMAAAIRLTYQPSFSRAAMTCLPLAPGAWRSRRVDRDAAAVDGRDRETVFVHHLKVGLDRLLGHLRSFLDRLTLGSSGTKTLKPPSASGCRMISYSRSMLMA